MHLDIQVGEHTNNYPEIAAKDKLTELQLRARQLLDQVEQIQKEQDYQRVRACHCTWLGMGMPAAAMAEATASVSTGFSSLNSVISSTKPHSRASLASQI